MRRFFSYFLAIALCASFVPVVNAQTLTERLRESVTAQAEAAVAPSAAASLSQTLRRQKPALGASEPVDPSMSVTSPVTPVGTPVSAFSMPDGIAAAGAAFLGALVIIFLLMLISSYQQREGEGR
jgi:hypothetical protein